MKQNLFLLVICMTTSIFSYAQSVTWDGGGGTTSWTDATNWSNDAVPTAATDVLIDLSGVTVDISGAAVALMVEVKNACTLNITSGAMLTISGATGDDGLETSPSGIIVNDGTIILSTSATNDIDGIYTKGTFTNNGGISIDGVGEHGIRMAGGSFTNGANGIINVTNVGQGDGNADGIYMDDDGGTPCLVTNNGTITITMTSGDDGIYLKDASVFVNNSVINVDGTAGGDMALHLISPSSDFNNTGTLTISNAKDYSIQVDGDNAAPYCFLTNTGNIIVNGGPDDALRLRRGGIVNNNAGGTITLNNSGDEAIQINESAVGGTSNDLSIFNNAGTVDINAATDHGMELFGNFNNLAGGVFKADGCGDDGIRVQTSTLHTGVFANDGEIRVDNSVSDDIDTDELANFVNSATAKFFPGSSPGDLKIRYAFDLGAATVEYEINGTANATEYDQILNKNSTDILTISGATANLVWGFIPAVGDCFKIVDESGQVAGPWAAITSDNAGILYTVDYFTNSAEVIICVSAIVPVEFTYFTGTRSDRGTDLKWETASEINNVGFDIERSNNSREWTKIGTVEGNENSRTLKQYSYSDEAPNEGSNFYRLKQNDIDGNYKYSNIVSVKFSNDESEFSFYPNPVGDVLYLDLNEELENVEIQIVDINGKVVWNNVGWIEKISLDDLSSGTYLLSVKSSSFKTIKQIIKN